MTNGDKIRNMNDVELSQFMRDCERQEIPYYQNCKECINKLCEECRLEWLGADPDDVKEDPDTFRVILATVKKLFPDATLHHRVSLAHEVYKEMKDDRTA